MELNVEKNKLQHVPISTLLMNRTIIPYLCVSDRDGDKVVGTFALFHFFLLVCTFLTVHLRSTVSSLPLSLLLGWFLAGNWREKGHIKYEIIIKYWINNNIKLMTTRRPGKIDLQFIVNAHMAIEESSNNFIFHYDLC